MRLGQIAKFVMDIVLPPPPYYFYFTFYQRKQNISSFLSGKSKQTKDKTHNLQGKDNQTQCKGLHSKELTMSTGVDDFNISKSPAQQKNTNI